jgi:hypothetical protein
MATAKQKKMLAERDELLILMAQKRSAINTLQGQLTEMETKAADLGNEMFRPVEPRPARKVVESSGSKVTEAFPKAEETPAAVPGTEEAPVTGDLSTPANEGAAPKDPGEEVSISEKVEDPDLDVPKGIF